MVQMVIMEYWNICLVRSESKLIVNMAVAHTHYSVHCASIHRKMGTHISKV